MVCLNRGELACHAVDGPPAEAVPPRTEYRRHMWSPVAADGPPGAMFIN